MENPSSSSILAGGPSSPGDVRGFRITLENPTVLEKQLTSSSSSSYVCGAEGGSVEGSQDVHLAALAPDALSALFSRLPEPADHECTEHMSVGFRSASLVPPSEPGISSSIPFPPPSETRPEQPVDLSNVQKSYGGLEVDQTEIPLTISRFIPDVDLFDDPLTSVSLTFSQPMVPLSSVTDMQVDIASLHISLTPQVDGTWRWLSTQTLQFEAKHRFPFSTAFTLSIARGCKSTIGGTLRSSFFRTFRTSPSRVVHFFHSSLISSARPLSPLFFLCFNQRIPQLSVLSRIDLLKEGSPDHDKISGEDLELVDESTAREEWADVIKDEIKGTWLAFKLKEKLLEKGTCYVLRVPSGCPSAEGSLTSTEEWLSDSFSTYGPLVVTSSYEYSYGKRRKQWHIGFSNELDHASISKSAFHVSPTIEDFKVTHEEGSSSIVLQALISSAATYIVTVDTSIKDIYGQKLDESKATAEFRSAPEGQQGFLSGPGRMVILNPSTRIDPFIPLSVTNFSSLHIQVFQVEVDDYSSAESFSGIHMTCMEYQKNPGKKVYDEVVELQCEIDEPFEYKIPLGSHLQHSEERYGLLLVVAQPTETAWERCGGTAESYVYRQTVRVWVQCTQLALDVYPDHITRSYTTLVSFLENGAPVDKATVRVGRYTSLTDEYGLTVVEAEHADRQEIISVQKDKDITFLPSVSVRKLDDQIFGWYVFDSRGVYRPTEEVHIKGYLRKLERKKNGGQQPVYAQGRIRYTVHDSRWNKLTMGDIPLNEYGSFFLVFRIQDNANLGDASVALEYVGEQLQESRYCHKVKIQEFRKPEFEVTTRHWGSSVLYTHPSKNSFVIASTSAKYYAGGPLEGARVLWVVQPSQTYYAPPGHPQYIFGSNDAFIPGCWRSSNWRNSPMLYPSYELSGKTDTNGKHEVKIEFGGIEDRPSSISVSATSYITDLNCQVQSATTDFMIHSSSVFVGFKLKDTFGKKGEKVMGEVIVCDVNGKPLPGVQVKVSIAGQGKQEKEDDNGLSAYVDACDEQDISLESDEKPMEFSFIPCLGGMYSMVFRVIDSENRYNESRCTCFYVSGGCTSTPLGVVSDFIPKEEAQIIPDKDMYEGGETANLLIQSPFWPAEGLLIMKYFNTNVGDKIRFQMQSNTHILSTYLDPDWIPRIDLQVLLLGSTLFKSSDAVSDTKEILRPAYATAESSINIALSCHRLLVHIAPMRAEEAATPGGTVHVSVKVTEEKSQAPLGNAEISIVMVDEAILHLGAYSLKDPLSSFYPECKDCHSSYHLREYCLMPGFHVRFSMPLIEAQCFANCFLQSARLHTENVNIARIRSNFTPLAAFVPHCKTNGNGIAEVRIDLPDNLTRYRIWAVAATEAQFGLGESSLDVQLPIMIRTSPPRFLNLEDKALISVVLQNQTNISLPLLVGMRKSNAKVEAESVGYSLTLHGSQRVAIPFHVVAAATGTAQFQVVVSTQTEENRPPFSDAAEVSVPIFIPSSSERVAIYGDMDETNTIVQPIKSPMDVFPLYGGLDISTSSTTLQTLTDGLLYLHSYPFDCNEQLASRIIGFLSLWEVMKAFRLKDLPQEELMIKLKTDLKILKDRQLSCGGWSWWTSGNNVKHQPFISLHVACALVMASKYDFLEVDSEMLENALGFCADIEVHLNDDNETNICVKETKSALLAYALYVQALNNKDVGKQASALLQKASMSQLSLEACGWILTALGLSRNKNNNEVKGLIDHVKSKVVETGAYAHFTTSYHDDGMSVMLHSNCRTDAILLEALLVNEASSPLCVKLAKGLQSQRRGGRWNSTQENCFVLSALNRFFVLYEKEEPNFTANVWMGEKWIMSLTCLGRSIETKQVKVPMVALLSEPSSEGMTQLLLQKKGEGRLYFRIGLEYTPRLLQQRAVSYGFSITRIYEGVRSPLHAVYDANTQTWELAAGEKVKVTLSLGTNCVRHHVALVDYLPAGCEPINPALEALSAAGKESSPCCVPWVRSWVDHVNMRDERIEAFCTVLRPGRYEYSYEMRATCRGMFIIPSSRVEEMYNPENFGRSASERCRIS